MEVKNIIYVENNLHVNMDFVLIFFMGIRNNNIRMCILYFRFYTEWEINWFYNDVYLFVNNVLGRRSRVEFLG